jgi:hypothetical protein
MPAETGSRKQPLDGPDIRIAEACFDAPDY